jgi:hypothetical protein
MREKMFAAMRIFDARPLPQQRCLRKASTKEKPSPEEKRASIVGKR